VQPLANIKLGWKKVCQGLKLPPICPLLQCKTSILTLAPDFQVHLSLAKYHEACRFTDDGTYDKMAAFFHLKSAAECNIVVGLVKILSNRFLRRDEEARVLDPAKPFQASPVRV
jgi:hypothetical protein